MSTLLRSLMPVVAAIALAPISAFGFELSPMENEFVPSPQQNNRTFFVENKGTQPVAAQVRVFKRSLAPDGQEVRTPTADFDVFPTQVTLAPREKRAVRVIYRGPGKVNQEQAYRLIAEQLPVSGQEIASGNENVQLKYLLKFVASIYVQPDGARSNVVVESAENRGGGTQLVIANTGNKHKTLKGVRVILRAQDGSAAEVDRASLRDLETQNLLPGLRIAYEVATPANLPPGRLTAELKFE